MAINKKRKFINNNDEFEPCQKLKIAKLDLDGFNYRDGFGAFYDAICSDNEIKRKKLRKLLEFLQENRDNAMFRAQIGPMCDLKFVAGLLWRYKCTLRGEDLLIYDILEHLENFLPLDFRIVSPLVFGEQSKNYYDELIKYGRSLHKYLLPDQVLEYFDQKKVWLTLMKMTRFDRTTNHHKVEEGDPNCYDPRFVLRTLVQLVKPGTKLNCKNMVTSNALSFCFASTSFYDEKLRTFAYTFLARFRSRLLELTDEHFPQRVIFWHLLNVFKNSIEFLNQRMSHLISHFMARVCKLAMNPEDALYAPLMAFLTQKPFLQLDSVPEFYKLFYSSSTEFNLRERQWMLRLISNAIVDSSDYGALCRVFAIESCMALFSTPMADYWSKLLLLRIFRACVELNSAARDLFLRLDFSTWLANAIRHPRTTVLEQIELATIFRLLTAQVKGIHNGSDGKQSEKLANVEMRRRFLKAKLRLNAEKIFDHLNSDKRISVEKDVSRRDLTVGWLRNEFHFS